jgi:hypothetical protein
MAELWDPATGRAIRTAALPSLRENFAAVALADGRALVAGGLNEKEQSFSSTYIFDPATESWSKSGLLGTARTAPVAALLNDGRVLLAGGYYTNGSRSGDSMGADTVVLAAFHPHLADVDLEDYAAALATAEIFDPSTGTWSPTGPMTYARSGARAVTMADGRVLIFGSVTPGSGIAVDPAAWVTAEVFDPATGRFTPTGPLPAIDRAGLQARGAPGTNPIPEGDPDFGDGRPIALPGGGAVMIGFGQEWKHVANITRSLRYDPARNAWSEIGETFLAVGEPTRNTLYFEGVPNLAGSASAVLPDGRVLIAGGWDPTLPDQQGRESAAAQFYDPVSGTWSAAPPMPETRAGGLGLTLADGSILVHGGNHCVDLGDSWDCLTPSAARFMP